MLPIVLVGVLSMPPKIESHRDRIRIIGANLFTRSCLELASRKELRVVDLFCKKLFDVHPHKIFTGRMKTIRQGPDGLRINDSNRHVRAVGRFELLAKTRLFAWLPE